MTSVAWMTPTRPGRMPSTPPSAQRGDEAGRRRFGVEAAVARAFFGGEDAGLAFEAEDAAVGVGLAGEHAGVVDEVARLEVVGAVGDDVVVLEDFERVGGGQHGVVLDDVDVRVEALEHLLGGVDLEFADGGLRVDDLALQVADSSTTSKSTRPRVPTPAAAR